jgi:hypothetical protein
MRRRRTLITSPLEWQLTAAPVAYPARPVTAERGGTGLHTPLPIAIVDTREQNPFSFARFRGWFSSVEKKPLRVGDYSVAGMEAICTVERKDLEDLVRSFTAERSNFIARLRQMAEYPQRLLIITAALSQVKSPYLHNNVSPNKITQSLIAALVGLQVPFFASRRTNSARRLPPPFYIRHTSITGLKPTTMAAAWLTTICKRGWSVACAA